jgi:hypothetical protein
MTVCTNASSSTTTKAPDNEQQQEQHQHQHQQATTAGPKMKETDGRDMSQAEVAELEALFAQHNRVKAFPIDHPQVDVPAAAQAKVVFFVRHAEGK